MDEYDGKMKIKENPANRSIIFALFLLLLVLSFINTASFRQDHFQELDSRLSYELMQHDPYSVLRYVSYSYSASSWSVPDKINSGLKLSEILEMTPDSVLLRLRNKSFFEAALQRYNDQNLRPESAEEIRLFIDQVLEKRPNLANLPAHGVYRVLLSNLINSLDLDERVASTIKFPLASTYSPGMGLLYYLVYPEPDTYESFFSGALFVVQFLNHFSVFVLVLLLIKIGVPYFAAIISGLFTLFSISFYSYGFHLGSTVFNLATFSLFFYAVVSLQQSVNYYSRLGIISAVLIYFSYLMAIPIAGLFLSHFVNIFKSVPSDKHLLKKITVSAGTLVLKKKGAIILIIMCLLIFFQPGQGIRGPMREFSEIGYYVYYSILNLVAWFNEGGENIYLIQLTFFSILILLGVKTFVARLGVMSSQSQFYLITCATILVYVVLLLMGSLNFAPARHILFLKVFIAFFYAFGLMLAMEKIKFFLGTKFQISAICLIGIVGLLAQHQRFEQVRDPIMDLVIPKEVSRAIATHPDAFESYVRLPIRTSSSFSFDENKGHTLVYLSQTIHFDEWLANANFSENQRHMIKEIRTVKNIEDKYSFMPFSAGVIDDGRFSFNRGNGLYATIFRVIL